MHSTFVCALCLLLVCIACSEPQEDVVTVQSKPQGEVTYGENVVYIEIQDDRMSIDPAGIQRGTTVVWRNGDPFKHELKSSEFGLLSINAGEEAAYTFNSAGVFVYFDMRNKDAQHKVAVN